jgi:hypothetical protein
MSHLAWNVGEIDGGDKAAKRRRLNDCCSTRETVPLLHSNYSAQDPLSSTKNFDYNNTRGENVERVLSTCDTESTNRFCHNTHVYDDPKSLSAECCYGKVINC